MKFFAHSIRVRKETQELMWEVTSSSLFVSHLSLRLTLPSIRALIPATSFACITAPPRSSQELGGIGPGLRGVRVRRGNF